MKAFGVSLVLAAVLLHTYLMYPATLRPRPVYSGSHVAFALGVLAPVLMIGLGVGLTFRKRRQ